MTETVLSFSLSATVTTDPILFKDADPAFFKLDYEHAYYAEHDCSPLTYELFIDIGTFYVFDKD